MHICRRRNRTRRRATAHGDCFRATAKVLDRQSAAFRHRQRPNRTSSYRRCPPPTSTVEVSSTSRQLSPVRTCRAPTASLRVFFDRRRRRAFDMRVGRVRRQSCRRTMTTSTITTMSFRRNFVPAESAAAVVDNRRSTVRV